MQEIKIYSPTGELLFSDYVDDSSYRLREIMGDNRLDLRFSLPLFVDIPEMSYCEFMTERYWMPRAQTYAKQHSEHYDYTLALEGSINFLKSTKLKFFDYVIEDGKIKVTSAFKLKFPFTGTPQMFADLLVANLKLKYPQYPWSVGEVIESEPMTLDFNHDYCIDLLPKINDKFKTEWELDKFVVHFRQVERLDDNGNKISFPLSYGYKNGILGGLKRTQYDNSKIINRVYIDGSDRNVDLGVYGNETILMPKSKVITHEGIDYTTDASGSYIERVVPLAGEEDSLDTSKHYPKRIGEVSDVEMINDEKGLYNILDASIPQSLDYSRHIIAGENMTLIFQTGQLAGKEFNVDYKHATRKFELVPIEDKGLIYPKGHLIPSVGDKYVVFHMNMPEEYYGIAEHDALMDAVAHLHKGEQAQYSYRWQLDGLHAKSNWGEIRGYLNIGYFVEFSDPQFLPDPVDVRIIAVKEQINNPQSPEITIANNVSSKTVGSVLNEIPTLEETVNRKDREVVSYVKREFKQSNETMQKLIESMLDFDGAIKPIAVQTMMMLVGDESLQYRYVTERDNPTQVASGIYFDVEDKHLVCPVGIIQHMTLGITSLSSSHAPSEYKFWNCRAYQSDVLVEAKKSYFLYLKASKTDETNAVYLISEEAIKMEALEGYYHFLVGVLNSEDSEGNRSLTEVFGFTEIMPGRITTDKVVSGDGKSYFDMMLNKLYFGTAESGFDWNVTEEQQFTIRGLINAIGAILGGFKIDNETFQSISNEDGIANLILDGKNALVKTQDAKGEMTIGTSSFDLKGRRLPNSEEPLIDMFSVSMQWINSGGFIRITPIIKMKVSPFFTGLPIDALYEENGYIKINKG